MKKPFVPHWQRPDAAGRTWCVGSDGARVASVLRRLAQGLYRTDAVIVADGLLATVAPARRH
jgi:hypothetical protein